MRKVFLFVLLLSAANLSAQFSISFPVVNEGVYAITDTVYMAPDGNDDAPGTFAQPVKSFNVAVAKLPFGQPGINGGNAFGLIMLKEGHYITLSGFQQYVNMWQSGDRFKNISVEGIGKVTIGGTPSAFAAGNLLVLSGDHIYIRNLRLQYTASAGILLARNAAPIRQHHILIEDVGIDSVGSFSMLLNNVDTILVRNCRSLYASRPGSDDLTSPCQWPSGIKFFNSTQFTIHDSEIAYTRGEGLNFQNSRRGQAFRNQLHDNGLNFYNENSAFVQFHHNLIYNTPGIGPTYWRNCPADTGAIWASGGMLIANEGSCDLGNLPVFQGCATKCIFPDETFPNVDSLFVYNNIFQNTGNALAFWEGATSIQGANCIRDVFIFNNTIIGALGMPGATATGFVNVFFPGYNIVFNSFYGYLQNVQVLNNVFTYDTDEYVNLKPVNMVFHPQHPGPREITFDGNLWIAGHDYTGPADMIRPDLPGGTSLLTDSLDAIVPCFENADWVYSRPPAFPFLTDDYLNSPRHTSATNVGALEFDADCMTLSVEPNTSSSDIEAYPNQCTSCNELYLKNLSSDTQYSFSIFSTIGSLVLTGRVERNVIPLKNALPEGIYILHIHGDNAHYARKILVL
ncbi:MAG: right-handed parallel beta-helix repeat-containing protein [Saprospiraceae bacterium]|nr:right-handed parallel beta-helix repeat-containing protein [Candidatus Opimibacter iunctus]